MMVPTDRAQHRPRFGGLRLRTVSARAARFVARQDKQDFNADEGGCTQNTQRGREAATKATPNNKRIDCGFVGSGESRPDHGAASKQAIH
jgi:hypothetical protein